MFQLSQLYVYPVKSLAGIRVEQWPVDRNGLQYDRKWMLVDENHQFLSQRRLPKMALIKTALTDNQLHLSAPQQGEISLPLHSADGHELEVDVWHDRCVAKTVSNEVDDWLSDTLETYCRLVYMPETTVRSVDPQYASPNDQTAFSDGFPFLLVSEASLTHLNRATGLHFSMTRFRPNLVIAGCEEAYAEDYWRRIRINDIGFRLPKPCSRCSVPAIDPDTALAGKEPLATLNRLRNWQNKVYFGQNALHDNTGILSVGTRVYIEETGTAQPPL